MLAKELVCGARFCGDGRKRADVLLVLRDKLKLYTRDEWADALGISN